MNKLDKPYSLLVFDWDGTLVDSIEQITTSLQAASKMIFSEQVTEEAARSVIGLGLQEAVERLHPDKPQTLTTKMADAYRHHYLNENRVPAHLFDGVIDMLDELLDRGFTMAIATGKSRIGLEHSLTEYPVSHYFTTTRCASDNRSKPHPEMLLSILDETRTEPSQTLMIGDSEHDLMMAKNANVDAVAVSHGAHTGDRLLQHKPLLCLDRVAELSNVLLHNKTETI
ncbi:MAG: HAD-IA family hydrolase [Gammaproteobacteria bacterium]|nr:HAD-IA family hydrolase [Gammaproteobacteria bacterium]MCW8924045.1 HAD-IA family hydrolase [Gammaproteobacteria bacterium]